MARIPITVSRIARMNHVPLAVLGYALRQAGVLQPLAGLQLPIKTRAHTPADKLIEGLVLILAGGRALDQVNLLLQPNRGLAQAWGQGQFAEQSTVSDTLNALDAAAIGQLQHAFRHITRAWSQACRHDFRRGMLWLDGDLTGLPSSRRAEGASKGFFSGKKIARAGSWPV